MRIRLVHDDTVLWQDGSNLPIPQKDERLVILGESYYVLDAVQTFQADGALIVVTLQRDFGSNPGVF